MEFRLCLRQPPDFSVPIFSTFLWLYFLSAVAQSQSEEDLQLLCKSKIPCQINVDAALTFNRGLSPTYPKISSEMASQEALLLTAQTSSEMASQEALLLTAHVDMSFRHCSFSADYLRCLSDSPRY